MFDGETSVVRHTHGGWLTDLDTTESDLNQGTHL